MSASRERHYNPRIIWTEEQIAVLQAALPQAATIAPYRLACKIMQEHGWKITAKNISNKLNSLLRAETRAKEREVSA